MSKMGISTLQSYKGAQVFEAVGLADDVVDRCFTGTTSRIQGADFGALYADIVKFHESAYPLTSSGLCGFFAMRLAVLWWRLWWWWCRWGWRVCCGNDV